MAIPGTRAAWWCPGAGSTARHRAARSSGRRIRKTPTSRLQPRFVPRPLLEERAPPVVGGDAGVRGVPLGGEEPARDRVHGQTVALPFDIDAQLATAPDGKQRQVYGM